MAFLPDGRLLVTEKRGALKLYSIGAAQSVDVTGVPAVEYAGQGGLGDVALHPDFASNGLVYLSYAESGERGTAGAAVARAKLVAGDGRAALDGLSHGAPPRSGAAPAHCVAGMCPPGRRGRPRRRVP